jgi:hypothetical protein
MRRVALVLAAALLVLGTLAAAVAVATTLRDRDDVTTGLDISKAGGAHNRASDQLVHTIDFYEAVDPADYATLKGKPPSSICVEIWTRSTPGESAPDYEACATPGAKGKGWNGSLARKRDQGAPLRVGPIKVEQPSDTRVVMRIDPDDLKRPKSYRWRAEATSFGSDCKAVAGCPDYAPDRPGTAETKLGTPRS